MFSVISIPMFCIKSPVTCCTIIRASLFNRFNRSTSSFAAGIMDLIEKERDTTTSSRAERKQKKYESRYDGRKKKRSWEEPWGPKSDDPTAKVVRTEPFERVKRKKCALLLGYCGKNYFGMQRNPGQATIEEQLLLAMKTHGWIPEEGYITPQQSNFQRAARTDKGVSAARQCVSVKIPNDVDLATLNGDLPADIKIFAVKRVTKGFNSKEHCDARTYTYTLPTVAFTSHDQLETISYEGYRSNPVSLREKVDEVLQLYEGTKNYHNFTAKKGFSDPSAKRVILAFTCGEPFVLKDVEFVTLKVKGQSFMLHQIRKMVGLALAIIRGLTPPLAIEKAMGKIKMDIPTAPGLGLMLDQVHYDRYNKRYSSDGMHDALQWEDVEPEIELFIKERILPQILETEITERPMMEWLPFLTRHSYDERKPDDPTVEEDDSEDVAPGACDHTPEVVVPISEGLPV